jgi:hypothetical protein
MCSAGGSGGPRGFVDVGVCGSRRSTTDDNDPSDEELLSGGIDLDQLAGQSPISSNIKSSSMSARGT